MRFCVIIFTILSGSLFVAPAMAQDVVRVFAAASMSDVMRSAAQKFEEECDCKLKLSLASSSILARQIAVGAPADIYISANREWVEWLKNKRQINGNAVRVAGNALVLAARKNTIGDIKSLLEQRFSMADPVGVPAGIYGQQALQYLQVWESVKTRAVFTENVRVALSMIARGDLMSGIVYASDLSAEPSLKAAYTFDPASHNRIDYIALQVSENKSAKAFISFLGSAEAQEIFVSKGFSKVSDD